MIIIENSKELTRKLLKLTCESSKGRGYKENININCTFYIVAQNNYILKLNSIIYNGIKEHEILWDKSIKI